jgi:Icc-related predicted phosphoesterase
VVIVKIYLLSDLHLEFAKLSIAPEHWSSADVIVLAGDCGPGEMAFDFAKQFVKAGKHTIIVNGNHDYYRSSIEETERLCQELDENTTGITYLQNDYVLIQGIRFLGSTLWTDYNEGRALRCELVDQRMIDYKGRRFRTEDAMDLHHESVRWLRKKLSNKTLPTVVVTHHAPSYRSCSPRFIGDDYNPAFLSNLDALIEEMSPRLWLHGHTHHSCDYVIGATRVVSNQRGYPRESCGFDVGKIIEI